MKTKLLLAFLFAGSMIYAQNALPQKANNLAKQKNKTSLSRTGTAESTPQSDKGMMVASCTDKVDWAGSVSGYYCKLGGVSGAENYSEVFTGYTGQITKVDFTAQKIAVDKPVQVSIHALDGSYMPTGSPLGSATVTVNNTTEGNYVATFSSPVTVTNGFAIVIWSLTATDSTKLFCTANGSGSTYYDHCYEYESSTGFTSFLSSYSLDVAMLFRPTIKFNMPSTTLTATPSTVCPNVDVMFTGAYTTLPGHFNSPVYNPSGFTNAFVYGDGSPNGTISGNHQYTTPGTKNATYTMTYTGYNGTCPSTPGAATVTVSAPPNSAFSYSYSNLDLTVTNTSTGGTSYNWDFGDLTTSTLMNPPVHTYSSPGTYIVELDVSGGACGTDIYTQSITVANGSSGGNAGVTEITTIGHLGIYPNPASTEITLDYNIVNNNDNTTIDFLNSLGQVVKSSNIGGSTVGLITVDISDLASGTYFVKLSNDKGNAVHPFVKR